MSGNVPSVTRWWRHVERIALGASKTDIAAAAGVSQPTVSRWASGEIERASADAAVRLAIAYGTDVGDSLVAAGVLDDSQLPVTIQRYESPDDATLLRLLSERLQRDREAGEHGGDTAATSEAAADRGGVRLNAESAEADVARLPGHGIEATPPPPTARRRKGQP